MNGADSCRYHLHQQKSIPITGYFGARKKDRRRGTPAMSGSGQDAGQVSFFGRRLAATGAAFSQPLPRALPVQSLAKRARTTKAAHASESEGHDTDMV